MDELISSVHTTEYKVNAQELNETKLEEISNKLYLECKNYADKHYNIKCNVNKFAGYEIYSFADYQNQSNKIKADVQIDLNLKRVDFRVDFFNDAYEQNYKINKFLLLLIQQETGIKNSFSNADILKTDTLKSIKLSDNTKEIEYYNKKIQAPYGNVNARLEFRHKRVDSFVIDEEPLEIKAYKSIAKMLKKATQHNRINHFLKVQNDILLEEWTERKGKYGEENNFLSFVIEKRTNIFTKSQLNDLFIRAEPKQKNRQHIIRKVNAWYSKHKGIIDLLTIQELTDYSVNILESFETYFSN